MRSLLRRETLVVLAVPFVAKLIANAGEALQFLSESHQYIAPISRLVWFLLILAASVVAVRYLITRSWLAFFAVLLSIVLSVTLPAINFNPEYLKFKANRQTYLAEIEADPSPQPKFKIFLLREFADFPAGGSWYYVVYDETKEIGLPPDRRTSEWNEKHSRLDGRSFRGPTNPNATMKVTPLEGDFFLVIETY